jgi:hypothetical protein
MLWGLAFQYLINIHCALLLPWLAVSCPEVAILSNGHEFEQQQEAARYNNGGFGSSSGRRANNRQSDAAARCRC